ncbi:MAG: DNA gyrase modulator, partial [Candidatus Aminicenantes bacterium]
MSLKSGVAMAATPALMSQLLSCRGAEQSAAIVSVSPELLNTTIRKALENGGEFADVYVENRISRRILMEESKFKSAVFGISQGAGVRVISGDKTGFAYTDDIN